MIIGMAGYLSPEQALEEKIDARSDLFSFGVVLYLMLKGRMLFEGETASDIIDSILTKEPEPLENSNPEIPAKLKEIVERSLEKKKSDRFQTAKEMLDELKQFKKELVKKELEISEADGQELLFSDYKRFQTGEKPAKTDEFEKRNTAETSQSFF